MSEVSKGGLTPPSDRDRDDEDLEDRRCGSLLMYCGSLLFSMFKLVAWIEEFLRRWVVFVVRDGIGCW